MEDSNLVYSYLLDDLEFSVILLLNWLPPKTAVTSLPCCLIHSMECEIGACLSQAC